jgi:hypothetical protein
MNRPAPPLATDLPEALATDTQRDPNAWLLYWRNINQYIQELEENLSTAHAEVQSKEQAAQAAQTSIAERNGIIQYQREQLATNQKQITQLEVEKAQLIAVTTGPTANTPHVNTTPTSSTAAKAHADDVVRSAMPATALPSGNPSLSEKIPDPKEFDGTRNDLRRFIQQIHGKMTANADRFSTATACLTYVAGRLTGRAYELILPKTVLGIPQFTNYPELLEYLEKAFGDPDRIQNAQNKLFSLKQKAQDFSVYFSEFQRLALEGEMPESALTPLLFQGISRELQDMLLHNPAPSNEYTAYANHLQMLDNRYRQHQQQASRNRSLPSARTPSYAATVGRASPAPARPEQPNSPRLVGPSYATTPDPDPMDLSHVRHQRYPNGRRERGECFRCGSKDHRVAQCPEPDNRPMIQGRASHLYRLDAPPASGPNSPPGSIAGQLNGVSLD